MKTHYFTLGQMHTHSFNGYTLDKDCVIKITDEEPRNVMMKFFGTVWAFEYFNKPKMEYFPRGVYNLTENKWE
jgi:hypothetical protein